MYQDFSTAVAFGYLREQIEKKEKSLTDFSLRHWQDYSQKLAACQSPDSVLISELVNQLCANKDVDFRAIVFVRTRKGASILANLLNSHTDLISCNIRVETIAGLNNSGVDTTTKREQLEKLKRLFRDGDTRVLVATSVADEGLDVAKCNLERLMRRVLRAIEENRIDLVARVREAAEDLWLEIQREDDTESRRIAEQKSLGIVYSLLCRSLKTIGSCKCDETLCTSKDIKTRNSQYCVCNPSFWSKVRNEEICGDVREARYGAVAKVLKDYFTPETIRNYDLAVMTEASNKPVISSAGVCFHFI
ncbi:helicase protein [Ancylostoma ceylanicum]|uniref:Helicase protein n=1 Tax=Ancylostoma ceylanicum TaxID=53326 RepID=A0A0D6LVR4_9BILA|nr:helicase protein [Ancylostoma ceylanicum]